MESFSLVSDGPRGVDAMDGVAGQDGRGYGARGENGSPAGNSSPGIPGGVSFLHLESEASSGGSVPPQQVLVRGATTTVANLPLISVERVVGASSLGQIIMRSLGGDGGHGGVGGRGGDGAQGYPGSDATQYSSGGNGGPGGNGGNGGLGSNGSDGGAGGQLRVSCFAGDEYLLMVVPSLEDPSPLVHGGTGGRAGQHGVGGSGGSGGPGGSSYSWTESRSSTYYTTDSEGRSVANTSTTYITHTNPGGSWGFSGSSGTTPSYPLYCGRNGIPGSVQITVSGERRQQASQVYDRRYNLSLEQFYLAELPGAHEDGVFEFGEICFASGIGFCNSGGMPTPEQRIRVTLNRSTWATPFDSDELFIAARSPIEVGGFRDVPGQLRFTIVYPNTEFSDDYGPLMSEDSISLSAVQLGFESADYSGRHTLFQRPYYLTLRRTLTAKFPIGNSDGIMGLRSLAPGETSFLYFQVFNCASKPFGSSFADRRRVCVELFLESDEKIGERDAVDPDLLAQVKFIGPDQEQYSLVSPSGNTSWRTVQGAPLRGCLLNMDSIAANNSAFITCKVSLPSALPVMSSLKFLAALCIQDLNSESWRVVQRRRMNVTSEAAFTPSDNAKVILVTNTSMGGRVFHAWKALLKQLGLHFESFSVVRYGHLDPALPVLADGKLLGQHLTNKLLIIPNVPFNVGTPTKQIMKVPTALLPGLFVRTPLEGENRPRVLILSDASRSVQPFSCPSVKHFVEPATHQASSRIGGADFAETADFWRAMLKGNRDLLAPDFPNAALEAAKASSVDSSTKANSAFGDHVQSKLNEVAVQINDAKEVKEFVPISVPSMLDDASDRLHSAAAEIRQADPSTYFHTVAVHGWTFCCHPTPAKLAAMLEEEAEDFALKLHDVTPSAAFTVVAESQEVGPAGTVCLCFPRWRLGRVQLRARRAAGAWDSTATHVYGPAADGGVYHDRIASDSKFALALTLPFPLLLESLQHVLATHTATQVIDLDLLDAVVAAVVAYLADDVWELLQPGSHLRVENSLTGFAKLLQAGPLHDAIRAAGRSDFEVILHHLGALSALSRSVKAWAIPFGRRREVARRIEGFIDTFLASSAPDSKASREEVLREHRVFIRQEAHNVKIDIQRRRPILRQQGLPNSRMETAFDYCRRPVLRTNGGRSAFVTRDIESAQQRSVPHWTQTAWSNLTLAESIREQEARTYYKNSTSERARLLLGPAAGLDNRFVSIAYETAQT